MRCVMHKTGDIESKDLGDPPWSAIHSTFLRATDLHKSFDTVTSRA